MTREKAMKAFNFALATALVGAAVQSTPAVASDNTWACEVVLCISNPGGPTQYPACVPPITKLWRVQALGGSFPTCTGGGIAKTNYKKPDDGRPGRLTVTWTEGRHTTSYQTRNRPGAGTCLLKPGPVFPCQPNTPRPKPHN